MSKNCLVTKLKAVVNNPDLPVLETMHQFTLDAIAASGNSSMTDAQKLALNHFFYQLGAFSDGNIWNKIIALTMPVICNDNVAKALTNYKTLTVKAALEQSTFDHHGLVSGAKTYAAVTYTGSSYDLSFIAAVINNSDAETLFTSNRLSGINNTDAVTFVMTNTASQFAVGAKSRIATFGADKKDGSVDVIGGILSSQDAMFKAISNGEIIEPVNYEGSRDPEYNYTDAGIFAEGTSFTPLCISIAANALTEIELETVMLAAKTLKDAFVPAA